MLAPQNKMLAPQKKIKVDVKFKYSNLVIDFFLKSIINSSGIIVLGRKHDILILQPDESVPIYNAYLGSHKSVFDINFDIVFESISEILKQPIYKINLIFPVLNHIHKKNLLPPIVFCPDKCIHECNEKCKEKGCKHVCVIDDTLYNWVSGYITIIKGMENEIPVIIEEPIIIDEPDKPEIVFENNNNNNNNNTLIPPPPPPSQNFLQNYMIKKGLTRGASLPIKKKVKNPIVKIPILEGATATASATATATASAPTTTSNININIGFHDPHGCGQFTPNNFEIITSKLSALPFLGKIIFNNTISKYKLRQNGNDLYSSGVIVANDCLNLLFGLEIDDTSYCNGADNLRIEHAKILRELYKDNQSNKEYLHYINCACK